MEANNLNILRDIRKFISKIDQFQNFTQMQKYPLITPTEEKNETINVKKNHFYVSAVFLAKKNDITGAAHFNQKYLRLLWFFLRDLHE